VTVLAIECASYYMMHTYKVTQLKPRKCGASPHDSHEQTINICIDSKDLANILAWNIIQFLLL
jgi:hypothetical protein